MKPVILIFMALLGLNGCSPEGDGPGYVLDGNVEISVKDQNGTDLLNPDNPGAFKNDQIKLFYLIDGKVEEVYKAGRDWPRNFLIYKHSTNYRIKIFPNDTKTEDQPITYIQWNNTDIDTLKCEFLRERSREVCTKVYYNGELRYPLPGSDRYFEVVK